MILIILVHLRRLQDQANAEGDILEEGENFLFVLSRFGHFFGCLKYMLVLSLIQDGTPLMNINTEYFNVNKKES